MGLPRCTAAVCMLAAVLAGCATDPAPPVVRRDLLGTGGVEKAAERTIVILPETRWVNVTSGETIRFVVGDRSFTWNFQTGATVTAFDLNQVAPAGMLTRRIVVYVAINPLYISNS